MTLDWNDVRFFLAVARSRRVSKAATALGVDHTTVARRIAALEERLGVALFTRTPGGWDLTKAGTRVHRSAQRMAEAAEEVTANSVQSGAHVEGLVRIATSETLGEYFVVPAIRALRDTHPGVRVVVSTAFETVDLLRGDADLALRLVRPTDPRLVARKVAEPSFRLYASRAYVKQHGKPTSLDGHPIVTYEDAIRADRRPFRHIDIDVPEVAFQANSARILVAAAVAGIGIVQLPSYVGDSTTDLVSVLPALDKAYRVWLVVPQAKRRVAAIRVVSEHIARHLGEAKNTTLIARFKPPA